MTACARCSHDPVKATPETAPDWLLDCDCSCHVAWRIAHGIAGEVEPAR